MRGLASVNCGYYDPETPRGVDCCRARLYVIAALDRSRTRDRDQEVQPGKIIGRARGQNALKEAEQKVEILLKSAGGEDLEDFEVDED
ncbi:MAG: hypothetical protein P8X98_17780 [Woeseiaceae bacterium]